MGKVAWGEAAWGGGGALDGGSPCQKCSKIYLQEK